MDAKRTGQQTNVEQDSASGEEPKQREKSTTPKEELSALWLQRIHEFREESMKSPEKLEKQLQGCLGPVICDLLEYSSVMKSAVDEMISEEQSSFERLHQLRDSMDDYLRLHRQVERYAQLICRIQESGKPSQNRRSR